MSSLAEIQQGYIAELEARAAQVDELLGKVDVTAKKARAEKKQLEKMIRDAHRKLGQLGGQRALPSGEPAPPQRGEPVPGAGRMHPNGGTGVSVEERREAVKEALADGPLRRAQIALRVPGGGQGLHFLIANMLKQGDLVVDEFSSDPTYRLSAAA